MEEMFSDATSFNQNLNFNVQRVFSFKEMFKGTRAMEGQIDFQNMMADANVDDMFSFSRLQELGRVPNFALVEVVREPEAAPVDANAIHRGFNSVDTSEIPLLMYPILGKSASDYNVYARDFAGFLRNVRERFQGTLASIPLKQNEGDRNVDAITARDKELLNGNLRTILNKLSQIQDAKVFAPLCAPFVDYMYLEKNKALQQAYVVGFIKSNATAYVNDLSQTNVGNISCAHGIMERLILEAGTLLRSVETAEAQRIMKKIFGSGVQSVQEYFTNWTKERLYNPDFANEMPGDAAVSEGKKSDVNKARLEYVRASFISDATTYYEQNDSLTRRIRNQIEKFAGTIDMSAIEMADLVLGGGLMRSRRRMRRKMRGRSLKRSVFKI